MGFEERGGKGKDGRRGFGEEEERVATAIAVGRIEAVAALVRDRRNAISQSTLTKAREGLLFSWVRFGWR